MFSTDREFEDEVRRIARLLWPSGEYGGAAMEDGRERDGIFETDEFIYCVECTVSRRLEKAVEDGLKLEKLIKKLSTRHPHKFIKAWFISLHEPTADQRNELGKYHGRVVACSYDQFRADLLKTCAFWCWRRVQYLFHWKSLLWAAEGCLVGGGCLAWRCDMEVVDAVDSLRSPRKKLLRFFLRSRNGWKAKCQDGQGTCEAPGQSRPEVDGQPRPLERAGPSPAWRVGAGSGRVGSVKNRLSQRCRRWPPTHPPARCQRCERKLPRPSQSVCPR